MIGRRGIISGDAKVAARSGGAYIIVGIGLLRGRSFLPAEGGARTAVVLDRLAANRPAAIPH